MTFTIEQAERSAERSARVRRGEPCKLGHSLRYRNGGKCVACNRLRRLGLLPENAGFAPRVTMIVSPWALDEFGNPTRTVRGE